MIIILRPLFLFLLDNGCIHISEISISYFQIIFISFNIKKKQYSHKFFNKKNNMHYKLK